MTEPDADVEVSRLRARLTELELERTALQSRLVALERPSRVSERASAPAAGAITDASTPEEKLALFRSLFAGRPDVFPVRWENAKSGRSGYAPACANEWVRGVCDKPTIKCGECGNQAFIPVSLDILARHLRGREGAKAQGAPFVVGVYPLLSDDTCCFLAADFDDEEWAADALAFVETCRGHGITAALERSRSGNGGHVWIFFAEPVPARDARQLGALLLTEAMERRPDIGFASYDRFFPSQDSLPTGGFGNLIALPLQRAARARGNSVFIDDSLRPFADQWAFLSSLPRTTRETLTGLVRAAEQEGRILGVRMPVDDENADQPWLMLPSRRHRAAPVVESLPSHVDFVLADGLYIDRTDLPPVIVALLIRLAAFQNPEFYRAQAMRMSTHGKPRIISCAELHPRHIALPRGCFDETLALLRSYQVEARIEDRREVGESLSVRFLGTLREEQAFAFDALSAHDFGVLAASPAFGKTVVAAALIAKRACSTLVLVHRRELLTQWVERLREFLSVEPGDLGTIAGGRKKPTRRIDVAVIQSLVRKGEVSDLLAGYGQLIVDECHHVSAASFELVARRSKAKYVVGLSATVARRDGHQPIIFMQCGPVRHRVNPKEDALRRGIAHRVVLRETAVPLDADECTGRVSVPKICARLALDAERNAMIVKDVAAAFAEGRTPLVLTERRDHLEILRHAFEQFTQHVVVLRGGMKPAARRAASDQLRASDTAPRIILATGRYLGEGFDDPRLDTLFIALPIAWKGTLQQYVGRLHRDHDGKSEVVVYDYADMSVPVLARMAAKRRTGYRALGYVAWSDR
ncbi:MAG: TOTE conflict system archaeo-eukaryotic primase domain-containing protein [Gemmatimonadaceae bacterium]